MGSSYWGPHRHPLACWKTASGREHVLAVVGDGVPLLALYERVPVNDVDAAEARLRTHSHILAEIGELRHPGLLGLMDVMRGRNGIVVCRSYHPGIALPALAGHSVPEGIVAELLGQLAEVGLVLDRHPGIPAPTAEGVVVGWDGRVVVDALRLDLLLAGEWPERRRAWTASLAVELRQDERVMRAGWIAVADWLRRSFPEDHARDEARLARRDDPGRPSLEPPDWP